MPAVSVEQGSVSISASPPHLLQLSCPLLTVGMSHLQSSYHSHYPPPPTIQTRLPSSTGTSQVQYPHSHPITFSSHFLFPSTTQTKREMIHGPRPCPSTCPASSVRRPAPGPPNLPFFTTLTIPAPKSCLQVHAISDHSLNANPGHISPTPPGIHSMRSGHETSPLGKV